MSVVSLSPSVDQRRVFALIFLAGQQFDHLKLFVFGGKNQWDYWGLATEYSIYRALEELRGCMQMADYVPLKCLPFTLRIARTFPERIDRLIESIGEEKIQKYGRLSYRGLRSSQRWEALGEYMKNSHIDTIFPFAKRLPIEGKMSDAVIRQSVEYLTETNHKEFVITKIRLKKDTKEDPCISHRPRFTPRKRRFSMIELERPNEICRDDRSQDIEELLNPFWTIHDDLNLKDCHHEEFITYCKKTRASGGERWACSTALANYSRHNHSYDDSHSECFVPVWQETLRRKKRADSNFSLEKRTFRREFAPLFE